MIYSALREMLQTYLSPPLVQARFRPSQVKQLSEQKVELTREVVSIVARLGRLMTIAPLVTLESSSFLFVKLWA